ncbi:MAG: DUF1501 domain-containing protein [Candidatus Obscuribacter sp.]|nr:DUF1501 domain-containing protein [Candidatus Obscuribacter sp.]
MNKDHHKLTSRRDFLALTALTMAGLIRPEQLIASAQAATQSGAGKRALIVLTLGGGNDGLNTVVPFAKGAYYDLRPKIAGKQDLGLPLDTSSGLGFHPALKELHELYKKGQVAVVGGVGYPSPNRSHFRSIEIWQTAQPDIIGSTGWLGRYLDLIDKKTASESMMLAVNIDPILPKSLLSRKVNVPSVYDLGDFRFKVDPHFEDDKPQQIAAFKSIYSDFNSDSPFFDKLKTTGLEANSASEKLLKLASAKNQVKYPDGKLAASLRLIAQMMSGNVGAKVYTLTHDGFDTHANQLSSQPGLLSNLSKSISAFFEDLSARGLDDDATIMVFSEFGRRAAENGGRGTDHGTAAPCFVIGKNVKGGLYGESPDLARLDNGDLRYTTDFRALYATVLDDWLKADSREIIGKRFDNLGLFGAA